MGRAREPEQSFGIVQIETPVGVANADDIAMVTGVDVLLGSNGDMTNFSGLVIRQERHPSSVTGPPSVGQIP